MRCDSLHNEDVGVCCHGDVVPVPRATCGSADFFVTPEGELYREGTTDGSDCAEGFLNLEQSAIATIRAGTFDGMDKLKKLSLSQNDLTEVPSVLFKDLSSVSEILLDQNKLAGLTSDFCNGLTGLQTLDLNANELETVPDNAFQGCAGLKILTLSNNRFTITPSAGAFAGLVSLEELDMQRTSWKDGAPSGLFADLGSLKKLDWSYSEVLGGMPEDIWTGLDSLEQLNVDTCEAPCYPTPPATVKSLTAGNSNECMAACGDCLFVRTLDGMLTRIGDCSGDGSACQAETKLGAGLNFANRALVGVEPGTFDGFSAIQTLSFGRNSITEITADLFKDMAGLKILSLNNNQITTLPAGICGGATSLLYLEFGNNDLATIDADAFQGCDLLTNLVLSNNHFDSMPSESAFAGLPALKILNITGTNWASGAIPRSIFSGLTSLMELDWSFANVNEVPSGVFAGLEALKDVDLSRNPFSALDANLFVNLTVTNLYVGRTGLACVPILIKVTVNKIHAGSLRVCPMNSNSSAPDYGNDWIHDRHSCHDGQSGLGVPCSDGWPLVSAKYAPRSDHEWRPTAPANRVHSRHPDPSSPFNNPGLPPINDRDGVGIGALQPGLVDRT